MSRAEECVGKAVMPSMDHFQYTDYHKIYEPADDTYLLIDALWSERTFWQHLQPRLCVELGPGSGAVSAFTAAMLQTLNQGAKEVAEEPLGASSSFPVSVPVQGAAGAAAQPIATATAASAPSSATSKSSTGLMLAVDINEDACRATAQTCLSNGVHVEIVRADKWSSLQTRLKGSVDVLIFNPPYVPTPDEEVGGVGIEAAWAGGLKGRRVLDQVLPSVGQLLSPNGVFYLIAVTENDPVDIAHVMEEQGFVGMIVAKRRAFNEALIVLKFRRKEAPGGDAWQHATFEDGLQAP